MGPPDRVSSFIMALAPTPMRSPTSACDRPAREACALGFSFSNLVYGPAPYLTYQLGGSLWLSDPISHIARASSLGPKRLSEIGNVGTCACENPRNLARPNDN